MRYAPVFAQRRKAVIYERTGGISRSRRCHRWNDDAVVDVFEWNRRSNRRGGKLLEAFDAAGRIRLTAGR